MVEAEFCVTVEKGRGGLVGVTCVGRRVSAVERPECGLQVGDRLLFVNGVRVGDDSGIVSRTLAAMPMRFEVVLLRELMEGAVMPSYFEPFRPTYAPATSPAAAAAAVAQQTPSPSTRYATTRHITQQGRLRELSMTSAGSGGGGGGQYTSPWQHLAQPHSPPWVEGRRSTETYRSVSPPRSL